MPLTTNRTNLELKRNSSLYSTPVELCYQSHQSGIETEKLKQLTKEQQATNRTNLELKHQIHLHQCQPVFATNRTNLELKLVLECLCQKPTTLPIAPIWN